MFQPIKSVKDEKIDKYEVLVRIKDREGNIIEPNVFIPIAKESGYYGYITRTVLEKP